MTPLEPATVAELWAHARVLAKMARTELSPAHARRAMVMLAIAGSGNDVAAFEKEVKGVHDALRALALDPVPLFDAASALVAEDDVEARSVLVNLPRRDAPPPRRLAF